MIKNKKQFLEYKKVEFKRLGGGKIINMSIASGEVYQSS